MLQTKNTRYGGHRKASNISMIETLNFEVFSPYIESQYMMKESRDGNCNNNNNCNQNQFLKSGDYNHNYNYK